MLFKIGKVYVSISIYFLLMIVWVILTSRVNEFLCCLISLVLHELGHIFMIYLLKEKISIFYIIPFGFSCRLKNQSVIEEGKMFKILLAGPMTSFIVSGLAFFYLKDFAVINLIIGVFNFIPIGYLDGGRIFRILMQS